MTERVIVFAKGMLGFPDLHVYRLIDDPEHGSIVQMISVDRPDVRFLLVDPFPFVPDYQPAPKGRRCLVVVNKVGRQITANLVGPVFIAADGTAEQWALKPEKYSLRHVIGG